MSSQSLPSSLVQNSCGGSSLIRATMITCSLRPTPLHQSLGHLSKLPCYSLRPFLVEFSALQCLACMNQDHCSRSRTTNAGRINQQKHQILARGQRDVCHVTVILLSVFRNLDKKALERGFILPPSCPYESHPSSSSEVSPAVTTPLCPPQCSCSPRAARLQASNRLTHFILLTHIFFEEMETRTPFS